MKKSVWIYPLTVTALLCLPLLAVVLTRVFWPRLIFPRLEITGVVLLCLVGQTVESYLAPRADHSYPLLAALGALTFGVLPFAAGFADWQRALALAAVGGVALTAAAFFFAMLRRRWDGHPLTPILCALCLFLAVQPLRGILL